MLFNSFPFLFLFMPVAVLGFFATSAMSRPAGRIWLALASLAFYTWWHPPFTVLLLVSIAFNYSFGRLLLARDGHKGQGTLLAVAVTCNLGALFYYKYAYALASAALTNGLIHVLWMDNVLLPLGISFFTFTQIGFLIDCCGGTVKARSPVDYLLFVTFFPHLIAGPILHHKEIMPQFARESTYHMDLANVAQGITLFFIGLFKKGIIADSIANYSVPGFADPSHLEFFGAWGAALAYSLQLYFDFSGYSDMAIGIAKMCNVQFPLNFNSPYTARNIIDFWQRWHMTLTRYLNLYLYNPIALSVRRRRVARGLLVDRRAMAAPGAFVSAVAIPLFFTMALAGIWHGAGLQFLIFGLLHACYLTINHGWRILGPDPLKQPWMKTRIWGLVCLLTTYIAVVLAQVFFRASSTQAAVAMLEGMFGLNGATLSMVVPYSLPSRIGAVGAWLQAHRLIAPVGPGQGGSDAIHEVVALLVTYCIVFLAPNSQTIVGLTGLDAKSGRTSAGWRVRLQLDGRWGMLAGLIAVAAIMGIGAKSEFLYFQF